MRLLPVLLLFCVCVPVSAADIAPATIDAAPVTNPDDATLTDAHDVLERWERVLTEEGSAARMSASNVCRLYLDAWATVDLDRAIELERKHRCRSSQFLLVKRLAAAHRWDDVLAIMGADPEEFHYRQPEFWARVACYGAKIGDLDVVDLAGRRVEIVAVAEPSEAGRPPRPSDRVALARFYVAASRLDVLRQQTGSGPDTDVASQTEHVLDQERRKDLRVATEDLWRAAGVVVPEQAWYLTAPQVSSFQGLAALESWVDASNGFRLLQPQRENFVAGLVETLQQERPMLPLVQIGILPPDLSRPVTSAWLARQMILGRTSVALTTLWMAPGSDVDRARNLAVMSRSLPAEDADLAASWRKTADGVLQSVAETDDSTVRALAELSLAYSSAGDAESAARCIDATFGAYSADGHAEQRSATKDAAAQLQQASIGGIDEAIAVWTTDADNVRPWATEYETHQVLLQAVAALPESYPRLPEILEGFGDREFGRDRLAQFEFPVDGLTRRIDLTHVIPESRIRDEVRDESHADFHEPHDAGDWLRAMEAAVRHHAGNPAWAGSYRTLAEESVRSIGLAATLEWCEDIADVKARFAAEIAAVREAIRPWRKSLPELDADDPEFVTPAVPWPTGC